MRKDLAAVLPNDVIDDVPIITIGGGDKRREPKAPSAQEDPHIIPLESYLENFNESEEDSSSDEIQASLVSLDLSNKCKKKDKKKHKKKMLSEAEFIKNMLDASKDVTNKRYITEALPFPPVIQKHQGFLTEHELYRILTNKYHFGMYGSDLYVRDTDGVYSLVNEHTVQTMLMATLTEEQQQNFKIHSSNGVQKRLLSTPEIKKNQLAFAKTKVLVKNGCFDLKSREHAKVEDSDFFVCRINAQFLPEEKLPCPNFDRYLETSSGGDKSIKKRICAMLGYLMTSGYFGKKIIVLGTAKNSGKSMIIRFYQRLVGPELVCAQSPFDMSENHALSEFRGKVANTYMDMPAAYIKPRPAGTMKILSGDDMVSINPKNQHRCSVRCYTKQILGTNTPIKLQQFDEAFWERIEIIPYIHSIELDDRIGNLEDLLWEERDAIVTKCLKAAGKLLNDDYQFPECPVADAMKDSWIGWQAYARAFLQTYCTAEEGAYTHSTPLHNVYVQYCQDHGYPYGTQTGFITFAKKLFPSEGNAHQMRAGVQKRGLPDVRFLGEL